MNPSLRRRSISRILLLLSIRRPHMNNLLCPTFSGTFFKKNIVLYAFVQKENRIWFTFLHFITKSAPVSNARNSRIRHVPPSHAPIPYLPQVQLSQDLAPSLRPPPPPPRLRLLPRRPQRGSARPHSARPRGRDARTLDAHARRPTQSE